MQHFLFGSWPQQAIAFTKQNPLQMASVALTAFTLALTLVFGARGSGSGDCGGISLGEGDGDSGGD